MPEVVFRIVGAALAITYMTVRTVYERRLGRPAKLRQLAETAPEDRQELLVVSYTTLPLWLYFVSPWLDFAAMGLPEVLRWFGAGVTAVGIFMFMWTHHALAGNWSPFVERPPAQTLITTGPYRYVRHPMYASFFLYNAGLWLLTSNWLAGGLAFIGFAWMYAHRVRREERIMLDTFGERYERYAEKTGRIVPGIGSGRLG